MRLSQLVTTLSCTASLVIAGVATKHESRASELLSLHKSLISISSTSGNETAVGHFLVDYLKERDYKVHLLPVEPYKNTPKGQERFNVVAVKGDDISKPRLLVSSHFDVVPPHIPYEIDDGPINKDTVIRGRGSADAKGSVAAMIVAVEEAFSANEVSANDVMLAFVVGEEVNGDGMRTFSDFLQHDKSAPKIEAAIFGEPTESKLACGHKGGLACTLKTKGIAGHSGYPWLGKSANEVTVRALAKILDTDLGSSEEYGNTTVNIGRFDGGVAANVIPESATVRLMVRVAIGPENHGATVVQKRIEDILAEVDEDAFDLDCPSRYGFVACDCDVEGFEPIVVNYGTDIPHLAGDHKRYLYGPGSILVAHGANEHVTVGELEGAVEGYRRLILHALDSQDNQEL
ncbi:peptidase family m20/M25/M40 domain-containing protein [Sarocladium implicatum]|nr:peptidase family m20/M25/M40 domain-containing protein [Sarocladium implicatum]